MELQQHIFISLDNFVGENKYLSNFKYHFTTYNSFYTDTWQSKHMYFELTFKMDTNAKVTLEIFIFTYGNDYNIAKIYLTGYQWINEVINGSALLLSDNNVITHIAHKYNSQTKEWVIRIGVYGAYFNSIYVEGLKFIPNCVLIDKKGFLQEVDKSWGKDFYTKKSL